MLRYLTAVGTVTLLVACGQREGAREPVTAAATPEPATVTAQPAPRSANVQLQATAGNRTYGTLQLVAMSDAVRVQGSVQGLQPDSEFGFHVHEKGDCSAPDASSAGDHFNPAGAQHGRPDADARHAGDMWNLKSDASGEARLDVTLQGMSLEDGSNAVLGKAIVVHAQPDDYTSQPAGNSGDRIACGVIELAASAGGAPAPNSGSAP